MKINIKDFLSSQRYKDTVSKLKIVRRYIPKHYYFLYAEELVEEVGSKTIEQLAGFFKIRLIYDQKSSFSKSFLENEEIVIQYKSTDDLYFQVGIVMKVFNAGVYFEYPNTRKNENISYYEKKAFEFSEELKKVFNSL